LDVANSGARRNQRVRAGLAIQPRRFNSSPDQTVIASAASLAGAEASPAPAARWANRSPVSIKRRFTARDRLVAAKDHVGVQRIKVDPAA
jgi:hypothetical protein